MKSQRWSPQHQVVGTRYRGCTRGAEGTSLSKRDVPIDSSLQLVAQTPLGSTGVIEVGVQLEEMGCNGVQCMVGVQLEEAGRSIQCSGLH